ncbi:MAG TPA: glycosyltransferase family 4 protein, partial [Chloroflexota bacterium]|nr:glycosyltransferase family 4 protein [Chloroflexota bacterium]
MKLAIVHDYLNQMGGAELVLKVLHELYPQAPIYTSIYAPNLVDPVFKTMDIRTTFMQRLPFVHRHHQAFLPVFPFAFESLDLRQYDVVLSMSSAWSKNVLTRPATCHINYCLTPMRF